MKAVANFAVYCLEKFAHKKTWGDNVQYLHYNQMTRRFDFLDVERSSIIITPTAM